jgi:hypothetical protein
MVSVFDVIIDNFEKVSHHAVYMRLHVRGDFASEVKVDLVGWKRFDDRWCQSSFFSVDMSLVRGAMKLHSR